MTEMTNASLPRHKFWGAGEPDCPQDLKAPNGELHTMRCKVCGDGWRKSVDVCFGKLGDALQNAYAAGRADEREALTALGILADCPACGGIGEREMCTHNYGPDSRFEIVPCPDCKGTGDGPGAEPMACKQARC